MEDRALCTPTPSAATPSYDMVMAALGRCTDPCCKEKQISIVDMGLVERVEVKEGRVGIDIILTSGWCPFSMQLLTMMQEEVGALEGVTDGAIAATTRGAHRPRAGRQITGSGRYPP